MDENRAFIHTLELSKRITREELDILNKAMGSFPLGKNSKETQYQWKSVKYCADGIQLLYKSCSEQEKKKQGYLPYRLNLIWNPSKSIRRGSHINVIHTEPEMEEAIRELERKIKEIFTIPGLDIYELNDFKLSRIDFTIDRKGIPSQIMEQIINVLWKMSRAYGFHENEQLQEKCRNFKKNRSFNVVNQSQDIEFVIYNKGEAVKDQKYPEEIQEYFQDTLRMELRCGRKYIRTLSKKGWDTTRSIQKLYQDAERNIKNMYQRIFMYSTHVSFLSYNVMEKLLYMYFQDRRKCPKRLEKMLQVVRQMTLKSTKNLGEELDRLFPSIKQKNTVQNYFLKCNVSPIPLDNMNPYLQSLDSLLGFYHVEEQERRLKRFAEKHTRGKEVFWYED